MNWGHKIALVYGGFVLLVATLITICVRQDDIFLVSPDYYKEEIAYQQQIDRLANATRTTVAFRYASDQRAVQLSLPAAHAAAQGDILFFRPSDARKDVHVPLRLDATGKQQVPVNKLTQGLWKVKIRWSVNDQEYFSEQVLVI